MSDLSNRMYCTVQELLTDIGREGVRDETQILRAIRAASKWIDNKLGQFMPFTDTKYLDGYGGIDLYIPPLLAATTIVDDSSTLNAADYALYPLSRCWLNGPYTRITLASDSTSIHSWSEADNIIAVSGRWGLYELTGSTGATVSSQDGSSTSLVASSGANISPGAVLLIESEQEVVEATGAATDSTANLAEDLDTTEEEVDVNNGTLVNVGEIIKINFEQMKVLDIASNTLAVLRGYNDSKRATHTTGADVYVYRTFTVTRGANGTTAAAHASKAISRYLPPDDVGELCRQLAALKLNLAATNYSGRAGDADLGETFYINDLPKGKIEAVRNNYRIWSL